MRLFIAIEIPENLKNVLGSLRGDIPGARWVPPDQIHLTLAFLGEVEEGGVEQLCGELSRIRIPAFELSFAGTGCFPDRRRPRVVWIGLEPEPHLNHLASKVHAAVLACGILQEERPFSPHITLARLRQPPSRGLDTFFDQHHHQKFPSFPVREFALFQSRLTPHGAEHIPLMNFSLVPTAVRNDH